MNLTRLALRALAALLMALSTASLAAIQTRDIDVRESAGFAFFDSVTGRTFVLMPEAGRYQWSASYAVVEPDGQVNIRSIAGATRAVFSEKWRTFAISQTSQNALVLVNADTLAQSSVTTGNAPYPLAIAEATGKAYVAGADPLPGQPWLFPGSGAGSLTEVDLRTQAVRTVPVQGFQPRHVLLDPAGARAWVIGTNYFRTAEEVPGFVRAFETASLTPGPLVDFGRRPEMATMSSDGKTLFAVSHVPWTYPSPYAEMLRKDRAALFVLDTATMALRTILLPAVDDLVLYTPIMVGSMAQGATPNTVYVLDRNQHRLITVDVAAGTLRVSPLESFGMAVAYNRVTDNVLVTFPRFGTVGVFSAAGDRLDTVSIGAGNDVGQGPTYSITIDANGKAYATNGPAGLVSVLSPDTATRATAAANMTDLWWNPAQSGWGLFVDQQGTTAFAVLFVKDAAGQPRWYVMSDGKRQNDGAFAGTLYRTAGPTGKALQTNAVGSMRIAPETGSGSTLTYTIDGTSVSSPIQRQVFATGRSCGWAVGAAKSAGAKANFTSLWFDAADPGWGLAVSHQGNTVFGVIFTYEADGRPTWAVMSNGSRRGDAAFGGTLYRVGPGASLPSVGSMSLAFGDTTTLTYSMDGVQATRGIQRQTFAPLVSDCASQ